MCADRFVDELYSEASRETDELYIRLAEAKKRAHDASRRVSEWLWFDEKPPKDPSTARKVTFSTVDQVVAVPCREAVQAATWSDWCELESNHCHDVSHMWRAMDQTLTAASCGGCGAVKTGTFCEDCGAAPQKATRPDRQVPAQSPKDEEFFEFFLSIVAFRGATFAMTTLRPTMKATTAPPA